jgi:hypothetical protein
LFLINKIDFVSKKSFKSKSRVFKIKIFKSDITMVPTRTSDERTAREVDT